MADEIKNQRDWLLIFVISAFLGMVFAIGYLISGLAKVTNDNTGEGYCIPNDPGATTTTTLRSYVSTTTTVTTVDNTQPSTTTNQHLGVDSADIHQPDARCSVVFGVRQCRGPGSVWSGINPTSLK